MIDVVSWPDMLHDPIVLAAFEGWNDAAEAASSLVEHLVDAWGAELVAELDPEDYYDFQVNRPRVGTHEGERTVTWPTTRVYVAKDPGLGHDVLLVQGPEPSLRWRSFALEIVRLAQELDATLLINLGALLADVPHTRPFPVSVTSEASDLVLRHDLEPPTYEGPTGIVGVLSHTAGEAELPSLSCWAQVPHYAAGATSPKGTLALLRRLEVLLETTLPRGDLEDLAKAWERGVDELASGDPEIAEYVKALEHAQDTADHPEASGDAIAAEFERYLRGRGDDSR